MAVDTPIIVAIAALAGSLVGACASVATTFLSQRLQARWTRLGTQLDEQEELYRSFVKEAVPLFIDALQQPAIDPEKVMQLFSILGCIRLTSSDEVLRAADDVCKRLIDAYESPPKNPASVLEQLFRDKESLDPLLDFTMACRRERAQSLQKV